jgi:hypothetical protein
VDGAAGTCMKHLRERLVSFLNDERPDRKYDRAAKGETKTMLLVFRENYFN